MGVILDGKLTCEAKKRATNPNTSAATTAAAAATSGVVKPKHARIRTQTSPPATTTTAAVTAAAAAPEPRPKVPPAYGFRRVVDVWVTVVVEDERSRRKQVQGCSQLGPVGGAGGRWRGDQRWVEFKKGRFKSGRWSLC